MSGAGRGTPRVSPTGGFLDLFEEEGQNVTVQPTNQAKFYSQFSNIPPNALVLTAVEQQYLPTTGIFEVAPGATRGLLNVRYVQGAPGGEVLIRLAFGLVTDLYAPSAPPTLLGSEEYVKLRRLAYSVTDTTWAGDTVQIPFVFPTVPPSRAAVQVYVREIGAPATPGTFYSSGVAVDNLSDTQHIQIGF